MRPHELSKFRVDEFGNIYSVISRGKINLVVGVSNYRNNNLNFLIKISKYEKK